MYSFVDQIRHDRRILLLLAAIFAIFVVCQAQEEASVSFSSGEELLPCVRRGKVYRHADEWDVDSCTTCNCDNGTVTCVIESCQPALCPTPIQPPGECCFLCPYSVIVKDVAPEVTSTNTIAEGAESALTLTVPIKFAESQLTTGVQGDDIWRLSVWASANADGSGTKFGYDRSVLNAEQAGQQYKKKEPFQFVDVEYTLMDPAAECDDLQYICTRIDRGDNPAPAGGLEYEFSATPDESAQIGCTGAPECQEPPIQCPDGQVYMECGSACPEYCGQPEDTACILMCRAGCFCEPDSVLLDQESDICIAAVDCPKPFPDPVLVEVTPNEAACAVYAEEDPMDMENKVCGSDYLFIVKMRPDGRAKVLDDLKFNNNPYATDRPIVDINLDAQCSTSLVANERYIVFTSGPSVNVYEGDKFINVDHTALVMPMSGHRKATIRDLKFRCPIA